MEASGRKRKQTESKPPAAKKIKIKDEDAEPGSGAAKDINARTSKSTTTQANKTSKGKGKTVESDEKSKRTRNKPVVRKPRNRSAGPSNNKKRIGRGKKKLLNVEEEDVPDLDLNTDELEDEEENVIDDTVDCTLTRKIKSNKLNENTKCQLTGLPVPVDELQQWCPDQSFKSGRRYFISAEFNEVTYNLNDCCLIKAEEGHQDYLARIVGFFESKGNPYITVKWFFRAVETVIKDHYKKIEDNRVFSSESKDDIPLECILKKVTVAQAPKEVHGYQFFYDMSYSEDFCTFQNVCMENGQAAGASSSEISSKGSLEIDSKVQTCAQKPVLTLLDMYAGCGGMSTCLCMGAAASNVNLVTKWAVDVNEDACDSLRYNHPETQVRCMEAEDFLQLLIKWKELCEKFSLLDAEYSATNEPTKNEEVEETESETQTRQPYDGGDYELEKIIGISYGNNPDTNEAEVHYKVKWKGWSSKWDSWEPASNLEDCQESIEDFVTAGYKSHILPLPGTVDVLCGGPPCQGISGLNRKRNYGDPLKDSKNFQMEVFMKIVNFLQPRFTLIENVVDIMRFVDGTLGRLAIARLVSMHYQVRFGFLIAGNFGLPQYRMRTFFWGAKTDETLPQFPLPTHKVIGRGYAPKAFERNLVKGDEKHMLKALVLEDAIRDLPAITTDEIADEREYLDDPITDFQRKIRLPKHELMVGTPKPKDSVRPKLYDHRPLKLSKDDNLRVRWIPKRQGANFRDLVGVIVKNNVASLDPERDRVLILRSRKPLVPNYAINYCKGRSKKPFGRLWWNETVSTVVGRAEPHNQVILHPEQDRVLSVRENARLQGFPDFYKFFGEIKARYIQVGNAVAVPVGRALGFALARAVNKTSDNGQVFELPPSFSR